jgi:hypothetical protein
LAGKGFPKSWFIFSIVYLSTTHTHHHSPFLPLSLFLCFSVSLFLCSFFFPLFFSIFQAMFTFDGYYFIESKIVRERETALNSPFCCRVNSFRRAWILNQQDWILLTPLPRSFFLFFVKINLEFIFLPNKIYKGSERWLGYVSVLKFHFYFIFSTSFSIELVCKFYKTNKCCTNETWLWECLYKKITVKSF